MDGKPEEPSTSSSEEAMASGQETEHQNTQVYVVDHRRLHREGLAALLKAHDESLSVTGVASVDEAVSSLTEASNDTVVLLAGERDSSGHCVRMDDKQQVNEAHPETPVLLICACEETSCMQDCIRKGAKGFVTPGSSGKALPEALHFVRASGTFVPMDTLQTLQSTNQAASNAHASPLATLTAKEQRVLDLLCLGKSNMDIADLLAQNENTVKSHINRILKKLNVTNRNQAVLAALPHITQNKPNHQSDGI